MRSRRRRRASELKAAVASRLGSRRAAGVAAVLAVALIVAASLAFSRVGGVEPTGRTTYVTVSMTHMRYSRPTIEVPAGNRLVISLRNDDEDMVHDLVLENGEKSGRLAPGESTRMDVGVVDHDIAGWCSVSGHRQMGMTLDIVATGTDAADASGDSTTAAGDAADDMDLLADPGPDFTPYDASLPRLGPWSRLRWSSPPRW